jgi:hypothetical protein
LFSWGSLDYFRFLGQLQQQKTEHSNSPDSFRDHSLCSRTMEQYSFHTFPVTRTIDEIAEKSILAVAVNGGRLKICLFYFFHIIILEVFF